MRDGRRFRPADPTWVALAIVVIGLVPLAILGVTSYRAAAHALRTDTESRLADAASQTSTQVDRLLAERWGDVQAFARNPRARSLDRQQIVPLMRALSASYAPNYRGMVVADRDGNPVAQTGTPPASADDDVSGEPWFEQALAGRESVVGVEQPEGYQVAFSAPIRDDDGSVVGVWVNFVSWPVVEDVVRSAVASTKTPTLHAFVLDKTRRVIASDLPDGTFAPLAGRDVPAGSGDGQSSEVRADVLRSGARGTDLLSSVRSTGYAAYPGLGWTVLAVQDRATALAGADRLRNRMLLIGGIAALLVIAAALAAARAVGRANRQRERLEETLHRSQKLEAVGRLAGGIAHDFNNLLTVIGGNAQLALEQPIPETVDARLREIAFSVDRAGDLVRQLLSFSRVDTIKLRVVDVNDEVTAVLKMLPRLIESNIEIVVNLADEPTLVMADPVQLEQVLLNLAINARDAMPQGGRLTVSTERTDSGVRLEVRDSGIGMDDDTRSRIFEPFFTTKEVGEGTGLGLATVYGIVTRAGGAIEVESSPGAGTRFAIDLPAADLDPETLLAPKAGPVADGRGERVLLAEDDTAVRLVTVEMLERAGYAVVAASDGDEALELLATEAVDVIVCDAMMPRLTGPELIAALRSSGDLTPVVLVSGQTQAAGGENDGLVVTIAKPFTSDELASAIRGHLTRRV